MSPLTLAGKPLSLSLKTSRFKLWKFRFDLRKRRHNGFKYIDLILYSLLAPQAQRKRVIGPCANP